MSKTIGVTIGKFMPLHKGHELMIKFGSMMHDELFVIVSNKTNAVFGVNQSYSWVCEFVRRENIKNVTVIYHIDQSPTPTNIDENGTVLDEDFQSYWKHEFESLVPNATHFVSSDMYGQTMANLLGIKWTRVDPNREMVPVSGTDIRLDPYGNFRFISDVVKKHFIKKFAIVGPESTGKSTMAKLLAERFKCGLATEYGRTVSESLDNQLTTQDFIDIADGQDALIQIAMETTTEGLIISDTEAYTTYKFGQIYLNQSIKELYDRAVAQEFDMYFILSPKAIEWVDDGTRVLSDVLARQNFFDDFVNFCKLHDKPYMIIDDVQFDIREYEVTNAILQEVCYDL